MDQVISLQSKDSSKDLCHRRSNPTWSYFCMSQAESKIGWLGSVNLNLLLFFRSPSPVQVQQKNEINKFSRTLTTRVRTLVTRQERSCESHNESIVSLPPPSHFPAARRRRRRRPMGGQTIRGRGAAAAAATPFYLMSNATDCDRVRQW